MAKERQHTYHRYDRGTPDFYDVGDPRAMHDFSNHPRAGAGHRGCTQPCIPSRRRRKQCRPATMVTTELTSRKLTPLTLSSRLPPLRAPWLLPRTTPRCLCVDESPTRHKPNLPVYSVVRALTPRRRNLSLAGHFQGGRCGGQGSYLSHHHIVAKESVRSSGGGRWLRSLGAPLN